MQGFIMGFDGINDGWSQKKTKKEDGKVWEV